MAVGGNNTLRPGAQGETILEWNLDAEQQCTRYSSFQTSVKTVFIDFRLAEGESLGETGDLSSIFLTLSWTVGNAGLYSCRQGTGDAEIDLVKGTAFSIPASTILIKASYPIPPVPPEDTTYPSVVINAMVGEGIKSTPGCLATPRRTIDMGEIVGGASSPVFPIPSYASGVIGVSDVFGAIELRQLLNENPASVIAASGSDLSAIDGGQVPIIQGSQFFQVINQNADPIHPRMVFFLSL